MAGSGFEAQFTFKNCNFSKVALLVFRKLKQKTKRLICSAVSHLTSLCCAPACGDRGGGSMWRRMERRWSSKSGQEPSSPTLSWSEEAWYHLGPTRQP